MLLPIFEVISEDDFVQDPERYIDQVNHQRGPILIRTRDGGEIVLLGWQRMAFDYLETRYDCANARKKSDQILFSNRCFLSTYFDLKKLETPCRPWGRGDIDFFV